MEDRKVYLDKHSNLLQLEEHMYPLVDVDKPNVFRNLFHYDEIPKIAFNDRIVPHSMPDEIWITSPYAADAEIFHVGTQVKKDSSARPQYTCKNIVLEGCRFLKGKCQADPGNDIQIR